MLWMYCAVCSFKGSVQLQGRQPKSNFKEWRDHMGTYITSAARDKKIAREMLDWSKRHEMPIATRDFQDACTEHKWSDANVEELNIWMFTILKLKTKGGESSRRTDYLSGKGKL